MILKDYQIKTLETIKGYLRAIDKEQQEKNIKHASLDAWQNWGRGEYVERKNGLNQDVTNFCLKIPTGGGKTLLATKTIDLINTSLVKKQTGLVLWIVPTTQIYNQTIRSLKDRDHPYRQFLDISSGGKIIILEKTDRFTPSDIKENLVIMMLMLPSANRKTKDVLKLFKDNGGFQSFFPEEDNTQAQSSLLEKYPNLDTFGSKNGFWGRSIKTSLGNTLKILSPIVILDEGQKAYSRQAQETIYDFNPSIIVELSATPPKQSNILVNVFGIDLKREEMIKLDLHVINKSSLDWKDTLRSSVNHRQALENKAKEYQQNTNIYIRPICLIQVERTGKDQRGSGFIHSEDAKEYLIKNLNIQPDQIAIKTSQKDELKEIDDIGGLMSPDCPVKYIITKQALQEGWDCPFAYVLTILTNPRSKTALTQLVGRILRQPYAKKTKVNELDESYVFCFQQNANSLLKQIIRGFGNEGLADLAHQISINDSDVNIINQEKIIKIRPKFKTVAQNLILPVFAIRKNSTWSRLNYEADLLSKINWKSANINSLYSLNLSKEEKKDTEMLATITQNSIDSLQTKTIEQNKNGTYQLDSVFLTKQITDIVSNPWLAFDISHKILKYFTNKYPKKMIINNFIFIIEEARNLLFKEQQRLAKSIFQDLLNKDNIRFFVLKNLGFKFPKKRKINTATPSLIMQKSLFDYVPEESLNQEEKAVAWYLEEQSNLFFWFRNMAKQNYYLQGWQKQKVYPDFIFTKDNKDKDVYVVETKGLHLKNEDTKYKQELFNLCNQQATKKNMTELGLELKDFKINYQVLFEKEWKNKLNQVFN
ncbi:DEAD/DEAH box helicase family protein [Patescibacteria group bacterium]|nr:DEAD/DEAH box helicase family protein [Patescibacteria group bacterium]